VIEKARQRPASKVWILGGALVSAVALILTAPAAYAASSPLAQALGLRSDVQTTTSQYIDRYEDRLTVADRRELRSTARETRIQLNALVRTVRRAEARDTKRAWRDALREHASAADLIESRFDDVRSIIEPELSFSEKLSAFADYSSAMQAFESLGSELSRRAGK
jgi:hypothetical protein